MSTETPFRNLAKVWPVFALIIVARATLTSENSTLLGDPMKAEGKTLGREIPVKISIFLTSAKDVKRSDPFVQQIPVIQILRAKDSSKYATKYSLPRLQEKLTLPVSTLSTLIWATYFHL
ncbi:7743_t:CDS:2 [Entrophospora sp. SA101]|nr:7743_t:CDS:2 [Entrophospora sp. SA101]